MFKYIISTNSWANQLVITLFCESITISFIYYQEETLFIIGFDLLMSTLKGHAAYGNNFPFIIDGLIHGIINASCVKATIIRIVRTSYF